MVPFLLFEEKAELKIWIPALSIYDGEGGP